MTTAHKISVYSDGSSGGSSKGAMGYGWLVANFTTGDILATGSGAFPVGTNNQAEMLGAIHGLRYVYENNLHVGNAVELVSDSEYCLGNASGQFDACKNLELVAELRLLTVQTKARTRWVRGHSGEVFNEHCDLLAKTARDKLLPDKGIRRRHRRRELRRQKRAIVKAYKRGEIWRAPLKG